MAKAYSYIRFSHPDQRAGDSYRRQQQLAQEYAKANGLELADNKEYAFFDAGKSAYKAKHLDVEGELRRFLDLVESGDIPTGSVLLVESLDRLSRERVSVALPRFLDLLNKGIDVVTLSDGKRYTGGGTDYTDLIVSIVYMAKAHAESDDKSKRVSAAWAEKKQQAAATKKPLGKACPAWLRLSDDCQCYEPIPERVEVIKAIFDLYLSGKGAGVICHRLNDQGVEPFGSKNRNVQGKWSTSSVRKILGNRALIGEYQPTSLLNGKRVASLGVVEGYYPVVVERSVFSRAQQVGDQRRTYKPTKQASGERYNVWQGIAKCYKCGSALHLVHKGKAPKGGDYLHCYSSRMKAGCDAKAVRLDRLEVALPEILTKVDSLSLVQESSSRIAKQLDEIEGELASARKQYERLQQVFDAAPSQAVGRRLAEAEAAIAGLEAKRLESQALTQTSILDKDAFLGRLDLVSEAGRHSANVLMKRLGLYAFVLVDAPKVFSCWVSADVRPPKPFDGTDAFDHLLFSVFYEDGKTSTQGYDDAIIDLQVQQGELTEIQGILEKADGYDDPSIPEWLRDALKAGHTNQRE